jgi:hypothetical protein
MSRNNYSQRSFRILIFKKRPKIAVHPAVSGDAHSIFRREHSGKLLGNGIFCTNEDH